MTSSEARAKIASALSEVEAIDADLPWSCTEKKLSASQLSTCVDRASKELCAACRLKISVFGLKSRLIGVATQMRAA